MSILFGRPPPTFSEAKLAEDRASTAWAEALASQPLSRRILRTFGFGLPDEQWASREFSRLSHAQYVLLWAWREVLAERGENEHAALIAQVDEILGAGWDRLATPAARGLLYQAHNWPGIADGNAQEIAKMKREFGWMRGLLFLPVYFIIPLLGGFLWWRFTPPAHRAISTESILFFLVDLWNAVMGIAFFTFIAGLLVAVAFTIGAGIWYIGRYVVAQVRQ